MILAMSVVANRFQTLAVKYAQKTVASVLYKQRQAAIVIVHVHRNAKYVFPGVVVEYATLVRPANVAAAKSVVIRQVVANLNVASLVVDLFGSQDHRPLVNLRASHVVRLVVANHVVQKPAANHVAQKPAASHVAQRAVANHAIRLAVAKLVFHRNVVHLVILLVHYPSHANLVAQHAVKCLHRCYVVSLAAHLHAVQ